MLRLQCDNIKDIHGNTYRVEVHDSEYAGSVVEFYAAAEGFAITWDGGSEIYDRDPGLKPSRCVFMIETEDSNRAGVQSFVDDVVGAPDGRFVLRIYKGGVLFWIGLIMPSVSKVEDNYMTRFEVNAADGLGYLRTVDYAEADFNPFDGKATILQHILTALGKIPYFSDHITAGQHILTTVVNWYEQNHATGDDKDPLALTRCSHAVFYERDINGQYKFMSCAEVLEQICERFLCRIYLEGGTWRVEQLPERASATAVERRYDKTGNFLSSQAVSYDIVIDQSAHKYRLSGGSFEWLPALREAVEVYRHRTHYNHIAGAVWTDISNPPHISPVEISATGYTTLQIACAHSRTLTILASYTAGPNIAGVWAVKVRVGNYYLKRDIAQVSGQNVQYTSVEWSTDPNVVYKVVYTYAGYNFPAVGQSVTLPGQLNIQTPALPGGGELEVQISYLYHIKLADGTQVDPLSISVTWAFNNSSLFVFTNTVPVYLSDESIFRAYSDKINNQAHIQFEGVLGDGPDDNSVGALEVQKPDGFWVKSSQWRIGTTGGYLSINDLFLREVIALQNTNVRRYTGIISAAVNMRHRVAFDGEYWYPCGGTFTARTGDFAGIWFAIERFVTGIANDEVLHILPEGAPGLWRFQQASPETYEYNSAAGVGDALAIAVLASPIPQGAVSQISVAQPLREDAFVAGDEIAAVNTITGDTVYLTVTQDVADGDTVVNVSGTANISIPDGAPVLQYIRAKYQQGAPVPPTPITDHGELSGLADDDHLQYVHKNGRPSGQDIYGGVNDNENLNLHSTQATIKGQVRAMDHFETRDTFSLQYPLTVGGTNQGISVQSSGITAYLQNIGLTVDISSTGNWLLQSQPNAGTSGNGVKLANYLGVQVYSGTGPAIFLASIGGALQIRTHRNTGNGTQSGVELTDANGLRGFKTGSSTPTFHLRTDGRLSIDFGGHATPVKGLIYMHQGRFFTCNEDENAMHPQLGFLLRYQLFGYDEPWAVGTLKEFQRFTSEYSGYQIYKIGYSFGTTLGSGTGTNNIDIKHTVGGNTTTLYSVQASAANSGVVALSSPIYIFADHVIWFECTSVKTTPARGCFVELYLRYLPGA
ncbi:MAG: hypothetical protein KatS3mg031_2998 [Chitinophagales bacterium]|nr:MAG: hypothetical protein KatS3mg031_2927 [Chitinophagales bacterium]GIV35463.1 MAG: hypothetical protein KatS3mg031_2998 [Chitinophagales bacterium]